MANTTIMDGAEDAKWVNEIEKIDDDQKDNDRHSTSSSDSEIFYNYAKLHSAGKNRLFGRQRPMHLVLGGGKTANIILWRKKQTSACIFGGITAIWIIFYGFGYHFVTFLCHSLILSFTTLFLWSYLAAFINISPPEFIQEMRLPEDLLVTILLILRQAINQACSTFREVASGKDWKKFLSVTMSLWAISVVGSWFSLLTLFYLVFVALLTVPVLYERNEDIMDAYAEKALKEIRKQYAVLDEEVIQKLPIFSAQKRYKHL